MHTALPALTKLFQGLERYRWISQRKTSKTAF